MEDYSESSSVRMEREMMQQPPLAPQQEEGEEDHTHHSSVMEDSSNNSLAAFDSEIRRMTRDADKILNDIRSESNKTTTAIPQEHTRIANVIPQDDDDDDNDDDTVGDDASLKGELERLDLVSLELRKSLMMETTTKAAASPWKFPTKIVPPPPKPWILTNVMLWGLVLYLGIHAGYRLVDSEGYLRLLL